MVNVAKLAVDECVTIDRRRLEGLVSELGEATAAEVIGAALEQMALALSRTLGAVMRGDLAAVARDADRLSRLAWQLGLVSLATVAIDVGRCAEFRDTSALGATSARLRRIGNQSLTRIWDNPSKG
ncbi:hypothetical protein [Paracoccus aestuariivivens]|uniref:Uncharacterized protein n=1 Tax=Paracoccus aestuariivivens TaxID=1820333 RepID=A0A6L6JAK3_9RHOB|nr:hypothetical protein [Paracoccus aestuariivivens]MTH78138.1 hypothetical protein [Paracoccus aestuariivivens]